MDRIKKILIIVLVAFFALLWGKDILLQNIITTVGSNVLGAPIKIGSFSLGLFTQKVRIRELRVYNPPTFTPEPFVEINKIDVDYDLLALLGGKLHLKLARLDMKEMVVIKNKEGKLNVDSLKVMQDAQNKKDEKKSSSSSQSLPMQIDVLYLNIPRIVYKDFTKAPMAVQAYDVGLQDKKFEKLTSVQQMVVLIMAQSLKGTAIQSAGVYAASAILGVGFLPAGIAGVLLGKDNSIGEYKENLSKVMKVTIEVLKKLGEVKSEEMVDGSIKAKVDGSDITVKLTQKPDGIVEVNVVARKMMVPQSSTANGIIYLIDQQLK